MAGERQLPGLGLYGFWDLGSNGWKNQNDGNLRMLSALVQGSVMSFEATVPGSPTNGDRHVITSGGDANKIALRDNGAWVYLTPTEGWTTYNIATNLFYKFDGSAWVSNDLSLYQALSGKAVANGYASLNSLGRVPASQLDEGVSEYANLAAFPVTGAVGVVYIALDTDLSYVWDDDGSVYVLQSKSGSLPSSNIGLKTACRLVAVSNVDIATGGFITIDGKATAANYRVLLTGQTNPEENGIYVAAAGAWTRASDANTVSEIRGAIVTVWQGTAYGSSVWFTTFKQGNTLDTTAMNWFQIAHGNNIVGMIDAILGSSAWQSGGSVLADTDGLTEGASNLYFTAARVRSTVLTGLSLASAAVVSATDTVLGAIGQLQAQITALLTAVDNAQTGTTYTLVLTDQNKEIGLSHATGCALTIPTNASVAFPVGTRIPVWNDSAGTHTIVGASGVTLNGIAAGTPTGTMTVNASGVRGGVILRKTATDTWTVSGAIGAVA